MELKKMEDIEHTMEELRWIKTVNVKHMEYYSIQYKSAM